MINYRGVEMVDNSMMATKSTPLVLNKDNNYFINLSNRSIIGVVWQ